MMKIVIESGNKSIPPSKSNKPELKYMSDFTIKKISRKNPNSQVYRMKVSYLLNPEPCK